MAFPSSTTILGKPRTGLINTISFQATFDTVINDWDNWIGRDDDFRYACWELYTRYPNLVGFFDKNQELWVWAECSQRWWKAVTDDLFVAPSKGEQSSSKSLQKTPNTSGMILDGGSKSSGLRWATWDAGKSEWIIKNDFCDVEQPPSDNPSIPTIPPMDDCAKYGINCPEPLPTGKIYTRIEIDDILPRRSEIITYGIWSDGIGNLTSFHTCSQAASTQSFHRVVYNKACGTCGSEPQFDLAYGHDAGSGSIDFGGYDWLTPTNAVYGQYRGLCLGREEKRFTIGNDSLDDVYVINVRRARMKERLDEGNIELNLAHLSGSEFVAGGGNPNAYTGSNVTVSGNGQVLRLIDDSRINFDNLSATALSGSYRDQVGVKAHRVAHGGQVYYMVSGSLETGIYNESNPHVYGMVYPHLGIIVLDADRLDASASFGTVRGTEIEGDNSHKLFTSIAGAAQYTDASGDVLGFQARRKETHWAEYFFIRVKNADYNYTTNPTFQTGSEGRIQDHFIEEPRVYVSTVGLYNERKELLAVGKISRPIQKTCTSEALFKVRLKY